MFTEINTVYAEADDMFTSFYFERQGHMRRVVVCDGAGQLEHTFDMRNPQDKADFQNLMLESVASVVQRAAADQVPEQTQSY